ncbi:MAG: DUF4340 domain-containing protein [Polyangiaceae bacterium]
MIGKRSIFIHAGLAVTSAVIALGVWTRDKQAKPVAQGEVTVWPGRPADVERIVYEGKKKRLELTSKKDDAGRYFVGTFEKEKSAPKPPADPDGGAPPPEPAPEKTTVSLVSITPAEKLLDLIAPLKSARAVGQVAADKESDFGLNEPEGTLTVKIRDAEHKLVIGGPTPGGGDRYAREPSTGDVFILKADVFRSVDSPESSMMERDLHDWKDPEIAAAKLSAGGKSATIVRGGPETKRFWASAESKDQADETIGNWMSKIDRMRPTEYVEKLPDPHETVVRIDYAGAGGPLGYLEIVRGPASDSGKAQYYVVTERTRLYGKVPGSAGEQVEQDLSALVK